MATTERRKTKGDDVAGLKWTVGDVEILQLVELEAGEIIQSIIHGATPERIREIDWLVPHFADEEGRLKALVQGFLVRSGGRIILIDTCIGNHKARTDVPEWGGLQTDFLDQLAGVGVAPDDVDVVVCTHIHMDHVGWNTTLMGGEWLPTFPNARHVFVGAEYEYWKGVPEAEIADDHASFRDSVTPIVQAGLADFVEPTHAIDPRLRLLPAEGHTPAHVSVLIESHDDRAIITGDMLHHPCQIARPYWVTDADTFPEQALATRERILAEIAGTRTLLIGSHFPDPVAGRVVQRGRGYALDV